MKRSCSIKVDIFFQTQIKDEEFKSIDVQTYIAIYSNPSLPRILPSFIFTRRSLIFIKYLIRSDGLRGKMKDSAILLLPLLGFISLIAYIWTTKGNIDSLRRTIISRYHFMKLLNYYAYGGQYIFERVKYYPNDW